MSDVFKEVDEDLRREQLKSIWDRFGIYIIGVAVLIVAATAGYRLWEYWQDRKAEQEGDRFIEAMAAADAGRISEAISSFEAIAADGGAYGVLARIQAAVAKSQSGLPGAAASELDAIAADNSAPPILRDIARLRAGLLVLDVAGLDAMRERLGPLAGVGGPFRHSARELLGLSAWRNGDIDAARSYFEEIIADTGVPTGIADRAEMMLSLIRARTDLATIAAPAPEPATLPTDLPAFQLPGALPAPSPLDPAAPAPAPSGTPFAPLGQTPAPSPFAPLPGATPFAPTPVPATPEPAPAPPAAETPAPAAPAEPPAPAPPPAAEPAPAAGPAPAPAP